jgi:hypothetical protein
MTTTRKTGQLSAGQALSAALGRAKLLQGELNERLRKAAERFERGGLPDRDAVREVERIEAALRRAVEGGR